MDEHSRQHEANGADRAGRWVFWGFVLVAGFFLVTEHRAHLFGALPYLLLLACPLMHLFHGRGGHHHHHHHHPPSDREADREDSGNTRSPSDHDRNH